MTRRRFPWRAFRAYAADMITRIPIICLVVLVCPPMLAVAVTARLVANATEVAADWLGYRWHIIFSVLPWSRKELASWHARRLSVEGFYTNGEQHILPPCEICGASDWRWMGDDERWPVCWPCKQAAEPGAFPVEE